MADSQAFSSSACLLSLLPSLLPPPPSLVSLCSHHRFGVSCYLLDVPTLYKIFVTMVVLVNLSPGACSFHSHLSLFRNLAFESLFPPNSCSCYALRRQDTPGQLLCSAGGVCSSAGHLPVLHRPGPLFPRLLSRSPWPLSQPPPSSFVSRLLPLASAGLLGRTFEV